MSSLQDFAQLQLTQPGMLGNPTPTPAPMPPPDTAPAPSVAPQAPLPTDVPMAPVRTDAPTPTQIGAGANALEGPAPNLHTPHSIVNAEQRDERQARIDTDKSYALQADAAKDNARIEADKAAAMQPLLNQHTKDVVEASNKQQEDYNRVHAIGEKATADYQANIQALSDKMANQPQDMFGRAGVNKVSGIIGLLLGGLGGAANGGKNMAVERLNQLTSQKLAQEKYEFEMLGKRADMSKNLYAQLRQQGLDDISAHNAAAAAKTDTIIAQMKATENSFVPSKAKNDMQNAVAQLLQQKTEFIQRGSQHRYGQVMQAYALEQKDRELQQQRDELMVKFEAAKDKPTQVGNSIVKDVVFDDNEFGKNDVATMQRFQIGTQALKEAVSLERQYGETNNWTEALKRAGLRKGLAGSLATGDVGNARVAEARVAAAEHEVGADPLIGIGQYGVGQSGTLSNGLDSRIHQAVRTRLEIYKNTIESAGGHIVPGSEMDKLLHQYKVGSEYAALGETPDDINNREEGVKEAAIRVLRKTQKTVPASETQHKGYVFN